MQVKAKIAARAILFAQIAACAAGSACTPRRSQQVQQESPAKQDPPAQPSAGVHPDALAPQPPKGEIDPDQIARALIAASPLADPRDAKARDLAADRLGACNALLDRADESMLWGGYERSKRFQLSSYRLTKFAPLVWAKLYLSTFMFPGTYQAHFEGGYTVIDLAAKFRGGLDPGDYPYPFWHSSKKWQSYCDTRMVTLVFKQDRLVAAFRRAGDLSGAPEVEREWNGSWRWTDASGDAQPRVALFSYLLSHDNPHVQALDAAYRNLEAAFRSQRCVECHTPENRANSETLVLFAYPNQALAARHSLVQMLQGKEMPPADDAGHPAGIQDSQARAELVRLAQAFQQEADAALGFEASHGHAAAPSIAH